MLLPSFSPVSSALFAVTPYTGNGSTQSIVTGQNVALSWIKKTNTPNRGMFVQDAVRGAGKSLFSFATDAEYTADAFISSFNGNGISITAAGSSPEYVNASGGDYALFSWLEQAGYMDIVTYTGDGSARTIAHNLVATPQLMIVKKRSGTDGWRIYHVSQGATKYGQFTTAAFTTSSNEWNDTAPTSSVFSLGTSNNVNQNTATYVAYLFAEKAGKSKFGSYTGNDGTNAITGLGFRPKAVLIKNTSAPASWTLTYNDGVGTYNLEPNDTGARSSAAGSVTLDSNGFTLLSNSSQINSSPNTFIYAAWG